MRKKIGTIIIADQNDETRSVMTSLFKEQFKIIEASTGEEAIAAIEKNTILSAVILSSVMPEKNGIEILEWMNENGKISKIPVFLLVDTEQDDLVDKAYMLGVSGILSQSVNPNVIKHTVNNTIELYRRRFQMEDVIQEQSQKLRDNYLSIIDAISALIESKDFDSGTHIQRIREGTSILLTEVMKKYPEYGLTEELVETIAIASVLHDVGKAAIPEYILGKPGKLTVDEFEIMKQHPLRGCELLDSLQALKEDDAYKYYYEICRWHHERWDGKGYPDGLVGEDIPIWAQAVAVADCYDALKHERIYKPAYNHDQAIKMILDGECGQFNPKLMKCLLKCSAKLNKYSKRTAKIEPRFSYSKRYVYAVPMISDKTLRLLELERKKTRVLAEMSKDIIFTYDPQEDVIEFSEKFEKVFQTNRYRKNAGSLEFLDNYIDVVNKRIIRKSLADLAPKDPSCKFVIKVRNKNGKFSWYEVYLYSFWEERSMVKCVSVIGRMVDITDTKSDSILPGKKSNLDTVTGFMNYKGIEEKANRVLADEDTDSVSLMLVDIDNFGRIRSENGSIFSSGVVKRVAKILKANIRSADDIARLGDDEFIVLLYGISREDLEKKCDIVRNKLQLEFDNDDNKIQISACMGISIYPENGHTFIDLLNNADRALNSVKRRGGNMYKFYDSYTDLEKHNSLVKNY